MTGSDPPAPDELSGETKTLTAEQLLIAIFVLLQRRKCPLSASRQSFPSNGIVYEVFVHKTLTSLSSITQTRTEPSSRKPTRIHHRQ